MRITVRLFVLLPLLLASCVHEHGETDTSRKDAGALSVAEARRFFENHAEHYFTRSGVPRQNFKGLNPGEFTPNWDKAKISQLHDLASVDVPIAASYRFRAIGSTFSNGRSNVRSVDVAQKLVVVKNLTTDSLGSYILTLIPSPAYAARHTGSDLCATFLNTGDKGKFSGIAIYTESVSGMLVRINQYRNGEKVRGVFLPGPPSERKEKIRRAKLLVGKIRLGRAVSISTRSWGEDTWDWENDYDNYDDYYDNGNDNDNNNDGYTDLGGGWFEDETGNLYYDADGDGSPDFVDIAPVVITPDPDPEPEDDPWFDDNGDDNDDWWNEPDGNSSNEEGTWEDDDDSWDDIPNNKPTPEKGPNTSNENTHTTTPEKLKSAAKTSVGIIIAKYGREAAYCNQGVREAFYAVFNKELPNINANDLIKYMRGSSEWGKINVSMAAIQDLANQGHFIVASWFNSEVGKSGHVALVVPGELLWGKWCGTPTALPVVMDTGAGCRKESQKLSESFGKDKHSQVEFYIYK